MAIYVLCVWVNVIRRDTRIERVDGVAPGVVAPGGVAQGGAMFLCYKTP